MKRSKVTVVIELTSDNKGLRSALAASHID